MACARAWITSSACSWQALRDAPGLYDDTAIFFFSDHGDFTGDYGLVEKTQNTFEDCLTRVPFIDQAAGLGAGASRASARRWWS